MDAHVATQCRRAKRSKAKALDLSGLGLPRWSTAIFELHELETLKLNDNSLIEIPSELSSLANLTMLDVSNNKIEKLPMLNFDMLQNLHSIRLEGNPVAKHISATLLRQLAQPTQVCGKSQPQVLRELMLEASGHAASPTTPSDASISVGIATPARNITLSEAKPLAATLPAKLAATTSTKARQDETKTSLAEYMKSLDDSGDEYSDDFHDSADDPPKPPQQASGSRQLAANPKSAASDAKRAVGPGRSTTRPTHWNGSDSDDVKPVRKVEKTTSSKVSVQADEVARLQAEVVELKAQLAASNRPAGTLPKASLATTLPSRLHSFDESDVADKLKQQLQDEQRRAKRLERDNQKLQDRMRESSMSNGSSAAPHVELSEIHEGEILSKSGGFSIIYKGTWHGTPIAIKKLFDPSNSRENLAEMDNEVEKLGKLRHPNILSLLAVHRKPPSYSIIMEILTGGSLFDLLHAEQTFNFSPGTSADTQDLIRIDESMAQALAFMHARNVVHRDVKSHNVLLSPHLEAKLCDFGLARMKSELMTGAMQFAGTPQYMAPELFRQQKYNEKVDVWAFGVLLWETMVKDIPFANLDVPEIRELVTSGKMLPSQSSAPRPIQCLIKSCWSVDSAARPAMSYATAQISNLLC
jgi:tRNA A-37 threonylcarbamoyl transferase component Bud32